MSYADTILHFETIGRERELTQAESLILEQAVRRESIERGRVFQLWLPRDDRMLIKLVLKRQKVPMIAIRLNRTERAVWRRIVKLRKAGKIGYISPPGGTGRYPRQRFNGEQSGMGA